MGKKAKPDNVLRMKPCARAVRIALYVHYRLYDHGRVPASVHKAK